RTLGHRFGKRECISRNTKEERDIWAGKRCSVGLQLILGCTPASLNVKTVRGVVSEVCKHRGFGRGIGNDKVLADTRDHSRHWVCCQKVLPPLVALMQVVNS